MTKNIATRIISGNIFLVSAVFISVFLGFSISASASTSATTGASPVSVTLENLMALRVLDKTATSVIDSISMDLDPTPNGSFTKNSMMVEVSTRNSSGYTLYLTSAGQGYTNSELAYTNALVFMDGESPSTTVSDKIPSLPAGTAQSPTSITEAEYSVRNSLYRNTWGYSTNSYTITQTEDSSANLEASNGTGVINTITENTNPTTITYTDIPEHSVNKTVKQTDSTAVLDLTPITVGVNSTSTNAAGTYQNTLEFTATGNAIPANYSLSFNKNGYDSGNTGSTTPEGITESTISGMPSTNPMTATSVATSYTFTLPSVEPETSFSGYVFKEWNTSPDGTGTSYAPGSTFTVAADDSDPSSTSKILHAIWSKGPGFWDITYMQDMTSDICNSVETPTLNDLDKAIILSGENNIATGNGDQTISYSTTYSDYYSPITVATIESSAEYEELTNKNNYIPQRVLIDYRGVDGTGTKENPATGNNIMRYVVRKLADGNCWMIDNLKLTLSTNHSYEVGSFDGETATWTPNQDNSYQVYDAAITNNTKSNIATDYSDYRLINHGNAWYYPWYAATAGQGTHDTVDTSVTQSLCPKGWRLPSGNNNDVKSFYYSITTTYGINDDNDGANKMHKFPLDYTPLGEYSEGKISGASYAYGYGPYGFYWSSTAAPHKDQAIMLLYGHGFGVRSQSTEQKYRGANIRCVSI